MNEKNQKELDSFYNKLKRITSYKEGDTLTFKKNEKYSASYTVWPVEFVKRSVKQKLIVQMFSDNVIDLAHLRNQCIQIQPGTPMIFTGLREPGYVNDNSIEAIARIFYYASAGERLQISQKIQEILGEGSFNQQYIHGFTYRIPYPHVLVAGSSTAGYVNPIVLKKLKDD